MAVFEPLILYILLFLSGTAGQVPAEAIAFSASAGLARIILYIVPALALIWHLLLKVKSGREWGIRIPGKKDLLPGLLSLAALVLIGFLIARVSSYLTETAGTPYIARPETAAAWVVLVFLCIGTGYLEESFFRFYLLSKRETLGLGVPVAALVSIISFAICHIYEGPWGLLNAVLSGAVLAFVFLRYRSLHGIALAHGLYNLFVYILSS